MNNEPLFILITMKHFLNRFFKHPVVIVVSCLVLTVFCGLQLGNITVDNDNRIFFPQNHASYKRLIETEDTFGSTVVIGVVLESADRQFVTPQNIEVLKKITSQLKTINNVDDVQSLTNIDYLSGDGGSLASSPLVADDFTGSPAELVSLRKKIADWNDIYGRVVISDDEKSSLVQVTLVKNLSAEDKQAALKAVRTAVNEALAGTHIKSIFVGDPVLGENSGYLMGKDLRVLIPLVVIIVLLCLFFSFKTLDGTLLPLITVLMGTCCSLGCMAMMKMTFTLVSTLIPITLVAVGSAYGIHVLNHYYYALDEWKLTHSVSDFTQETHRAIIISALKGVFLPVFLAGITTIAGFISLVTSPLSPLKSFAVFSSFGVTIALVLSVTFVPALLMIKPVKYVLSRFSIVQKNKETRDMGDTLFQLYHFFAGTKPRLILFCLLIIVVSVFGLRKLKIDTSLINYFPENGQVRRDVSFVDKHFAGTNSLYFVVKGPEKGSMNSVEILQPLDELQTELSEQYPDVGKVVSFTTFVKRMNQVMHIPSDAENPGNSTAADPAVQKPENVSQNGFSFDDFESGFINTSAEPASSDSSSVAINEAAAAKNADSESLSSISENYSIESTVSIKEGLALLRSACQNAGLNASVDTVVDELCKEMNYNGESYNEIPYDPAKYNMTDRAQLKDLVTQYLLLYSGSLEKFSDSSLEPSSVRVVVQMRSRSSTLTGSIMNYVKEYAALHFPAGYTIEATGTPELEYTMTNMIVSGQLTSLLFSLICVIVILAVSFKSIWAGLIGAVPLVLTILLNYMVMGIAGINLDMFTSLIASLAVGIGIDYTIHFMTNYKENRLECSSAEEATLMTFKKSGRGIVTNALSVGLGFIVLCFSNFVVLRYIGILIAAVMFTSSFLAMTVIPAILNMTDPSFLRK